MLGPGNVRLGLHQRGGQSALFPGLLAAQQRKIEFRNGNTQHLMPGRLGALRIGIFQRMTQMT